MLSFIDVLDRNIIDYHIGLRCTGQDAVFTLENALKRRNIDPKETNLVVRSDNGPQFVSHVFEEALSELGIGHERIPVNTPNKNAHIEAFHRILEDDCLSSNEFETYAHAYMAIVGYMDYYCNIRIHSSIKYLPPAEYYLAVLAGQIQPSVVRVQDYDYPKSKDKFLSTVYYEWRVVIAWYGASRKSHSRTLKDYPRGFLRMAHRLVNHIPRGSLSIGILEKLSVGVHTCEPWQRNIKQSYDSKRI